MTKYISFQIIELDFSFDNVDQFQLSEKDAEMIEQQIMDAIEYSNSNFDVDILNIEIIEGGLVSSNNMVDVTDGFSALIECQIEMTSGTGLNGIELDVDALRDQLVSLDYIGDYILPDSISVELRDYDEDIEVVEDAPDWDSMPGGPDYYDD